MPRPRRRLWLTRGEREPPRRPPTPSNGSSRCPPGAPSKSSRTGLCMFRAARKAPGRLLGTVLGVVVTVAVVLGVPAGPASAAPSGPSDPDLQQAQAAADAAAAALVWAQQQMAAAQTAVNSTQAASAIALDDYQAKQAAFQAAQTAANTAQAAADQAAADLQAAQDQLLAFARRSYMEGSTSPRIAALLTAEGPAQLLERAALLQAAGVHRATEVDAYTVARQKADAAEAAAQAALRQADALHQQAAAALAAAQTAERTARDQAAAAAIQQAQLQAQATDARAQLIRLLGEKQAADRAAQEEAAAAAATAGGRQSSRPPAQDRTQAGAGSASAAQTAIAAAETHLGTSYSWGGGGAHGPSPGIDLDAGVVGFDCSGLTQYAYSRAGIAIPRNSRAQYAALPKVARADLQPGDLVFWATDPADPNTIHHVALYLGGNQVIQAPESGDVINISTMWWTGYAGAVRPSA